MAHVALTSGAYQARSFIANAQRQINLYSEQNTQDGASSFTDYPTPGLIPFAATATNPGIGRCVYTASNGNLYTVIGEYLYQVSSAGGLTRIGHMAQSGTNPISMTDNGVTVLIGTGLLQGWQFNLQDNSNFSYLGPGNMPAFYGFNKGKFVDTYFLLNEPGTPNFYVSPSEYVTDGTTPFNALYFAGMSTAPDNLVSIAIVGRVIWLIGTYHSEFWYNSGASDFPFALQAGTSIEYGCIAQYSVVETGGAVLWLAQDKNGTAIVIQGAGYQIKPISNNSVQDIWSGYSTLTDAVAWSYQVGNHTFYAISFPSADATWVYDLNTGLWHQWAWADAAGGMHRHRCAFGAQAFGKIIGQDWQTGALYIVDQNTYQDNAQPIQRIRTFPHFPESGGNRRRYNRFVADMQASASTSIPVGLRISKDRGATWADREAVDLAGDGTLTHAQWRRFGLSRDMLFELSWSANAFTALNGAFIEMEEMGS